MMNKAIFMALSMGLSATCYAASNDRVVCSNAYGDFIVEGAEDLAIEAQAKTVGTSEHTVRILSVRQESNISLGSSEQKVWRVVYADPLVKGSRFEDLVICAEVIK